MLPYKYIITYDFYDMPELINHQNMMYNIYIGIVNPMVLPKSSRLDGGTNIITYDWKTKKG